MRARKNSAFRSGFSALLLRTDESARVYAPAERCYCSIMLLCELLSTLASLRDP